MSETSFPETLKAAEPELAPEEKPEASDEPIEEELDDDTKELLNQAEVLGANNKDLMQWLAQSGVVQEITGLGETRHEMFINFLREIGLISNKTAALFEVRWARYLNEKLCDLKKQAEEYIAKAESNRIKQTLLQGVHGPHAAQMAAKNFRPGKEG